MECYGPRRTLPIQSCCSVHAQHQQQQVQQQTLLSQQHQQQQQLHQLQEMPLQVQPPLPPPVPRRDNKTLFRSAIDSKNRPSCISAGSRPCPVLTGSTPVPPPRPPKSLPHTQSAADVLDNRLAGVHRRPNSTNNFVSNAAPPSVVSDSCFSTAAAGLGANVGRLGFGGAGGVTARPALCVPVGSPVFSTECESGEISSRRPPLAAQKGCCAAAQLHHEQYQHHQQQCQQKRLLQPPQQPQQSTQQHLSASSSLASSATAAVADATTNDLVSPAAAAATRKSRLSSVAAASSTATAVNCCQQSSTDSLLLPSRSSPPTLMQQSANAPLPHFSSSSRDGSRLPPQLPAASTRCSVTTTNFYVSSPPSTATQMAASSPESSTAASSTAPFLSSSASSSSSSPVTFPPSSARAQPLKGAHTIVHTSEKSTRHGRITSQVTKLQPSVCLLDGRAQMNKRAKELGLVALSLDDEGALWICSQCNNCRCETCLEDKPLPTVHCCSKEVSADDCVDFLSCFCVVKNTLNWLRSDCRSNLGNQPVASDNLCACCSEPNCLGRWACLSASTVCCPCLLCYFPLRLCVRTLSCCYNHTRRLRACRCPDRTATDSITDSIPVSQKIYR